ncbi:hypothetical protein SDC9_149366 [bioreactor metagenome]|uniref:Uncharacterized protein n=1 Tax=bioreactor metagenome TaxID=1076179 RepID=A0A645ENM9_9ZZZZ
MGGAERESQRAAGRTDLSGGGGVWGNDAAGGAFDAGPSAGVAGVSGAARTGGGDGGRTAGRAAGGGTVLPDGLWREGGHGPPAHLAAQGPSRGPGPGLGTAERNSDQERNFRYFNYFPVSAFFQCGMERSAAPIRGRDDGAGGGAGAVLRQSEAGAGVLLHVSDWVYSDRCGHAGVSGGGQCTGGMGHRAPHDESRAD